MYNVTYTKEHDKLLIKDPAILSMNRYSDILVLKPSAVELKARTK